jgi:uncharacterized protein involved in outer membrane biogenesis
MIKVRLPSVPRPLGKLLLAMLALLVLLASFIAYVALVGIAVDSSLYRKPLQTMLSEQLGRPVHLDGDLDLHISLTPALRVRDVRIAQPENFGSSDFVRVGELQVRLDLWPLVHKQFKADTLFASGVRIHLKQRADGSNNWTFPNFADAPGNPAPNPSDKDALPEQISGIDIRRSSCATSMWSFGVSMTSRLFLHWINSMPVSLLTDLCERPPRAVSIRPCLTQSRSTVVA